MKIKKLQAIFIMMTALLFGVSSASGEDYKTKLTLSIAAGPDSNYDETYILTVPATVDIKNSGWNSVGNINVKHDPSKTTTFDTSKKVVVYVLSENQGLINKTDSSQVIGYTIKSAESDTAAVTMFEFSAEEINTDNGTNKTIGVDVADYSNKPAGEYEDNIVYHVEVMSLKTVTWNASDITQNYYDDEKFSKDGITIYSDINFENQSFGNGATFTTPLGHFTKIEIETNSNNLGELGTGWTPAKGSGTYIATWTGSANTVSLGGQNIDVVKIVFTIELHNVSESEQEVGSDNMIAIP